MKIFTAVTILLLSCQGVYADLLSEHNQQHTAVQRAVENLYSTGCLETYTRGTGKFQLHSTVSSTDLQVVGSTLTVSCTKWKEPVQPDAQVAPTETLHILTWSTPTTRADKSPLPDAQIKGYYLDVNGVPINVGKVNTFTFTYPYSNISLGKTYKIRTQDTLNQLSVWSSEVTL